MDSSYENTIIDNVIYRQALVNISCMIRNRKQPALLLQGSDECNRLINMVCDDVRSRWDEDSGKLLEENRALKKKIDEMKSRGFLKRLLNIE